MKRGKIIALFTVLAVFLISTIAMAGRLNEFERDLEGDEHEEHHRHHHHGDYDDEDEEEAGSIFFRILFDILFSDYTNENAEAIETEDISSGKSPFHLSIGGSYMYVDPDLYAGSGWMRVWFGKFAFGGDYTEFTEDLGQGHYDVMGLGAVRMGFALPRTERLVVTWEGLYRFLADSETGGVGLGALADVMIFGPLYFESHANVVFFPGDPLWDLGGYLKVKYWAGLKIGYRSLLTGSNDLSGPEAAIMLEF